jgi:hypothetical protein
LRGPPIFDKETVAKLLAADPHFTTLEPDGSHFTKRWMFKAGNVPRTDKPSLEAKTTSVIDFFIAGPNGWYGHNAIFRYDLDGTLRTIKVPVLLVASPGDELYKAALRVKAMRPDFEFRELPHTEGALPEDAAAWAIAVADYIKALSKK